MSCTHPTTEPVYAYLHHANPKVGDEVLLANDGQPVAQICTVCLTQLPVNWGCEDCEWVQVHRLCQTTPDLYPGRPCTAHAHIHVIGYPAPPFAPDFNILEDPA